MRWVCVCFLRHQHNPFSLDNRHYPKRTSLLSRAIGSNFRRKVHPTAAVTSLAGMSQPVRIIAPARDTFAFAHSQRHPERIDCRLHPLGLTKLTPELSSRKSTDCETTHAPSDLRGA